MSAAAFLVYVVPFPREQTCYARSGREWKTYLVVEKVLREVESEGEEREELAPEAYCCVAAGG